MRKGGAVILAGEAGTSETQQESRELVSGKTGGWT
jgi:hypothetical protein